MNNLELNHRIDIVAFFRNDKYVQYLLSDLTPEQFPIETEVVIKEPRFCVPRMARRYHLDMYIVPGHLDTFDYKELATLIGPDFKGTAHYQHIVLEEVWEDRGDDGHVEPYLYGYMFKINGGPAL